MSKQNSASKQNQSSAPVTANAPQMRSRPFTPEVQAQETTEQPTLEDIQTQRENQSRLGHNFADIALGAPTPPPPPSNPFPVQAKLTIGQPNDKYEQEADRVAQDVVQRMHSSPGQGSSDTLHQSDNSKLQRQATDEEDELQMKPDRIQLKANTPVQSNIIQADFESTLNQAKGSGSSLDNGFRAKIESAMGTDFSGVKVHTDATANQLSQSIQAKAFTTGQDIFFKQGQYDPGSRGGQELLAHELTHVIQQNPDSVQRKEELSITQQADNATIQRALGKYQGSSLIEKGWVFYQKNPRVTPLGLSSFNFAKRNSGPIVSMGTPSEVRNDINKVSGQDMPISFDHEISGQFQGYSHNEEDAYYDGIQDFNFQLSASVDQVTLGGSGMQEVLDVRGMVINQLTNDLVGLALGGFQEVYEPKVWTDIMQAGADAYGVYEGLKEPKGYPAMTSKPQIGKVVDIVTINPVIMPGSDSSISVGVNIDDVKEGATAVNIPSANIKALLGGLPTLGGNENIEIEADEETSTNSVHLSIGGASRGRFV